ncbi:MAG: MFS transporter [Chloroflexi bacterium]|nr:MAG: MFS transporter [Chloroflexota bacterium]TME46964.1 MAG: MFS transporter [Chloroflexota bacterium]
MLTRFERSLGALNEREFRFLYIARAFSLFGDGLLPVALPFAVLSVDRSPTGLGFVLASRSVSLVIFLLIAGVIADRIPRKRVMIASDLVRFVAEAAMAILLIARMATLAELIGLIFVYGIGDAFFRPTSTGFVPDTVSRPRLQQANALISLTTSTFSVLGPVVAGLLVVTVGAGWALAVDATTFLISAFFVWQIRAVQVTRSQAGSFLRDLVEGWRVFRSRTWLWVDGLYSALGSFAVLAPFFVLGPIVAARSLGGAPAWATIIAAFGFGAVLGGVALLRFRPTRPLLAAVPPLVLLGVPPLLLAGPAGTAAIAVAAVGAGFGLTFFNTLFETTVQQHIPSESLSRVASIDWVMSGGLQPFGFVVAASAAAAFGLRPTLIAAFAWIVLSTAVVLAIPEVRNLPAENPEWTSA